MAETVRSLESWRESAACRGMDPNVFFPNDESEVSPAKAICAACPVREACLEYAIATRQADGVWGGLTEVERRRLRRRRQDQRRRAGQAA